MYRHSVDGPNKTVYRILKILSNKRNCAVEKQNSNNKWTKITKKTHSIGAVDPKSKSTPLKCEIKTAHEGNSLVKIKKESMLTLFSARLPFILSR